MASVVEQLIGQVFTVLTTSDATIQTEIGRRATEEYLGPHRVVAIPGGAPTIDPPDRPGDPLFQNAGRILLLRRFIVEWQCHDAPAAPALVADFTTAEQLYLLTLVAVRNLFHNSVRFSNERWLDQEEGQDSFERSGTVIAFTSTIDIPVYELRGTIQPLTATPPIVTTVTELDQSFTLNE